MVSAAVQLDIGSGVYPGPQKTRAEREERECRKGEKVTIRRDEKSS